MTPEEQNAQQFLQVIQQLDPDLYRIKVALKETGVNPQIIVPVIRQLGNLAFGTGYGKLQIFMQARVITQVLGEESDKINENALVEKSE